MGKDHQGGRARYTFIEQIKKDEEAGQSRP